MDIKLYIRQGELVNRRPNYKETVWHLAIERGFARVDGHLVVSLYQFFKLEDDK